MRLIQKILSHGLLIVLIVVAVLVYIRRDELPLPWIGTKGKAVQHQTARDHKPDKLSPKPDAGKPEHHNQKAPVATVARMKGREEKKDKSVEKFDIPPAPVVEPAVAPPPKQAIDKVPSMPVGKKPVKHTEHSVATVPAPDMILPEKVVQAKPATAPDHEVEYRPKREPVSPAIPIPRPAVSTPARAEAREQHMATAPVQMTQSVPRKPVVKTGSTAAGSTEKKLLQKARQLFWQRNIQAAEAVYRELGDSYPEKPDVWGEIGDFYFSLRLRKPAAYAYSRCIELLIRQGKRERAQQILGILYRLDAPRARELELQLQRKQVAE